MKFNGAFSFRVNIDSNAQNFVITSAGDDYYVLTRSGTTVTLHQNGEAKPAKTFSGTADIDTIGDSNSSGSFNGTMKEIQIYSSTSTALTANVNSRLAGL
jgi:hypothetical protein